MPQKDIRMLIQAFVLLSVGGLMLHIRIHPPAASLFNWIPVAFGAVNILLLPLLFRRADTAPACLHALLHHRYRRHNRHGLLFHCRMEGAGDALYGAVQIDPCRYRYPGRESSAGVCAAQEGYGARRLPQQQERCCDE